MKRLLVGGLLTISAALAVLSTPTAAVAAPCDLNPDLADIFCDGETTTPTPTPAPSAPCTAFCGPTTSPGVPGDGTIYGPPPEDPNSYSQDDGVSDDTPTPTGQPGSTAELRERQAANLLTGGRNTFPASNYHLFYIEGDPSEVLGIDIPFSNAGNNIGAISEIGFTFGTWIIHLALSIVGWLVFGFILAVVLAAPAVLIANRWRENIIDAIGLYNILGLAIFAATILAAYRTRSYKAIDNAVIAIFVLMLAALVSPVAVYNGAVNTVGSAAGMVLQATSGADTSNTQLNTSSDGIDQNQFAEQWDAASFAIEEHIIGRSAQLLTFGETLPEPCATIYQNTVAEGYEATDTRALQPLADDPACSVYAEYAATPTMARLLGVFGYFLVCLVIGVAFTATAFPAVKGQLMVAAALAGYYFLVIGLAAPNDRDGNGLRTTTIRLLLTIARYGILAILSGFALGATAITIGAVFEATDDLPMALQFLFAAIAACLPLGILTLSKRQMAKMRALNRGSTPDTKPISSRLNPAAVQAALTGAAISTMNGARAMTKSALLGSENRAGLLAGPRNPNAPVRQRTGQTPGQTSTAPSPATQATTTAGTTASAPVQPSATDAPEAVAVDGGRAYERRGGIWQTEGGIHVPTSVSRNLDPQPPSVPTPEPAPTAPPIVVPARQPGRRDRKATKPLSRARTSLVARAAAGTAHLTASAVRGATGRQRQTTSPTPHAPGPQPRTTPAAPPRQVDVIVSPRPVRVDAPAGRMTAASERSAARVARNLQPAPAPARNTNQPTAPATKP